MIVVVLCCVVLCCYLTSKVNSYDHGSACRLIMLYICIKFHENILKPFSVTERTSNLIDSWTDSGGKTMSTHPFVGRHLIKHKIYQQKKNDALVFV